MCEDEVILTGADAERVYQVGLVGVGIEPLDLGRLGEGDDLR